MNDKNPIFDIPESNESNDHSVVPGQQFDPKSIPKFINPRANINQQSGTPQKPVVTNNDTPLTKTLQDVETNTNNSKQSVPTSHNDDKKQKAQKKLTKIRKHKHFATIRFAVISFVVFLLLFNSQLIYSQALYLFAKKPAPVNNSTQPTNTASVPANTAEVVGPENVIIIPKINVNAPLVFIDTTNEKDVLRALQDGVVHYYGTANPGDIGNAVFFGHSSNDVWEKGNYKFVFVLLEKLVPGDTYEIHYQSRKYAYQVETTSVVAPTDLSVLNQTSTPYSTLITCTPPGTSWKRFVVKAKQISPQPTAPSQTATQSQPTAIQNQNTVLPSAAPNLLEQIQSFFSSLISKIFGNQTPSSSESQPANTPSSNHLPEVSYKKNLKMPTTF